MAPARVADAQAGERQRLHLTEIQDRRDQLLLIRLAATRARCDGLSEHESRLVIGELLAPYRKHIRALAARRLRMSRPQAADLDEISAAVLERLFKALVKRSDFDRVPFRAVVDKNTHWEIIDFWNRRTNTTAHEDPNGYDQITEIAIVDNEAPVEQSEAVMAIIGELGHREQKIVIERVLVGRDPQQIADLRGVHRRVVDTAYSRAMTRLRQKVA